MIGKVVDKPDEDSIIVECEGRQASAKCYGMDIEVGDWVFVESGYVLEVMGENEAHEMMKQESMPDDLEDEDFI